MMLKNHEWVDCIKTRCDFQFLFSQKWLVSRLPDEILYIFHDVDRFINCIKFKTGRFVSIVVKTIQVIKN